jgi:hypothetical protein
MDSRLNIYAQQTWKVLKSYDHQGKGVVWPGVDTIARKAGISKRSVDRAIAELRAAGLISREYRLGKNGRRLSNRYVLHELSEAQIAALCASQADSGYATQAHSPPPARHTAAQAARRTGDHPCATEANSLHACVAHEEDQLKREEDPRTPSGSGPYPAPPGGDAACRAAYPGGAPHNQPMAPPSGTDFGALRRRVERNKCNQVPAEAPPGSTRQAHAPSPTAPAGDR